MSIFNPADIGYAARRQVERLGTGARLFARLITSFSSWARFGLIRDQVFFLGNYSLSIIAVSGLFVGFVLGLQGYYTLKSFGSAESVGLLVALSLLRELGPVVTGLLFAGRAGTSLTAEIGFDLASPRNDPQIPAQPDGQIDARVSVQLPPLETP